MKLVYQVSHSEWMRNHAFFCQAIAVTLLSLTASLIANLTADNINPDGILYVEAAKSFTRGGLPETLATWNWPFYPILVSCLQALTGLSYEISARLICAAAYALLSVGFIALIKELSNDFRCGWIAVIVITFMVGLNEYRHYVIRDPGMWSCFVLSAALIVRFLKKGNFLPALLAFTVAIIGSLFRPEMIVYFVGIFLIGLLTIKDRAPLRSLVFAPALLLVALLCSSAFVFLATGITTDALSSTKLSLFTMYLRGDVFNQFIVQLDMISEQHLDGLGDDGPRALIIGIISVSLLTVLKKLGWAYSGILFFSALKSNKSFCRVSPAINFLTGLLILSTAIGLAGVILNLQLQGRVFVPASISLAAILSLWLHQWILESSSGGTGINEDLPGGVLIKISILLFVTVNLLDPFVQTGSRKTYLQQTGSWVQKNIAPEEEILSNDCSLYYYSERYQEAVRLNHSGRKKCRVYKKDFFLSKLSALQDFDYLLINRKKNQSTGVIGDLLERGELQLVSEFPNQLAQKVSLFRIQNKQSSGK